MGHPLADQLDAEAALISQDTDEDSLTVSGMLTVAAEQLRTYHRLLDALVAEQGCNEDGSYVTEAARRAEAFLEEVGP